MTDAELDELETLHTAVVARCELPWRAELFDDIWRVTYGHATDEGDRYDLFDDPPSSVVRFIAMAARDMATLIADLRAARAAIRQHRDERGDDRCHADDGRLYAILPEGDTRPARETAVTLENCARYIECRQTGREYISPQRRIEELEAEVVRLQVQIVGHVGRIAAQSELLSKRAERNPSSWTATAPTIDGWYWWRIGRGDCPKIVLVGAYGVAFAGQEQLATAAMGGEWCGPLVGPG